MSKLKQRIIDDMKLAMKARNTQSLRAIRMIVEKIKQKEIDDLVDIDDNTVVAIIKKMVKQRKDSSSQFSAAGRFDLADIEDAELKVISSYIPEQLSEAQILVLINKTIKDTNANSIKDMGRLMGILKTQLGSKADMSVVHKLIKGKLS